jgi:hypothetical protein
VAGTDYWLVIQVINGDGEIGTYKAQVYERVWPKVSVSGNGQPTASRGPLDIFRQTNAH